MIHYETAPALKPAHAETLKELANAGGSKSFPYMSMQYNACEEMEGVWGRAR